MSKLICVTPRLLTESGIEKQFVNTRYLKHLNDQGFNTVQLTLDNPNPEAVLSLCDGFLITGGTDIDPTRYGETNEGLSEDIDFRLDQLDKEVIEYSVKHHRPLLGICRGHQSINVFLGGTLYQDLGELTVSHKRIPSSHRVHMIPHPYFNWGSEITVNSYHHQAIRKLAPGLKVIGTHNDGTIEMVVHNMLPIFSVQWHPEIDNDLPYSKIIFDAFLKMVDSQFVSKL